MSEKLRLRLYQEGCEVFGWVVEQSESLRAKPDEGYVIVSIPDNLIVQALYRANSPSLTGLTLWVCGREELCDRQVFSYYYSSPAEATQACEDIRRLVAKANALADEEFANQVQRHL